MNMILMKKRWKYDLGIDRYNRAIEANPTDYRAYNNRGIYHIKRGRYDLAIVDFNKAIELNPSSDMVYVNRGTAHQEMGHYEHSIADFSEALRLNPKNSMAYNNRGFSLLLLGRLDEAESDIRKSIEISPENIYALNSMAELYAARNNAPEACRWLTMAIEKGYNNWSYLRTSRTYDNIRNSHCFRKIISQGREGLHRDGQGA